MIGNAKIVMTGHGRGKVFLDGHELESVAGFRFEAKVGAPNKLIIHLLAREVEIEGPAEVFDSDGNSLDVTEVGGAGDQRGND